MIPVPDKFKEIVEVLGEKPSQKHLDMLKMRRVIKDFRITASDGEMTIKVQPFFPADGIQKFGDNPWEYWNPWT